MTIPFVDLYAQYLSIQNDIDEAIKSVISNSSYIGGKVVKDFELAFAAILGVDEVVSCANGTDSLEIILETFGIGAGDKVLVPALSWISTSEAVSRVGATPFFIDVDPQSYCLDITNLNNYKNENIKAIIPVHLYGNVVNMKFIDSWAKENQIIVIEDCAQAHLASYNNKLVGTWGDAASFSFYPGKNLGAYGDAGCMIFKDKKFASKARMIANHGQLQKHDHQIEGRNSRLDGLQAAILSAKLPYLEQWTNRRVEIAKTYSKRITNSLIEKPVTNDEIAKHVFHLYVLKTDYRDELKAFLKNAGIDTAIHYPTALPFLKCYNEDETDQLNFKTAKATTGKILSIPMYPELTDDQIDFVIDKINSFSA